MENVGIYRITNPKGNLYIGQSTNLTKRIYSYRHKSNFTTKIYLSLKKYGYDSHTFEILRYCDIQNLNRWEKFYIRKFNTTDLITGLNLTHGGQSYFKHSEETKLKMSLAQMGNKKTLGRKQTTNEIQKRVSKTTGKKRTEAQNKRSSIAHMGNVVSNETRIRLSIALKGINNKKVLDTQTNIVFENTKAASLFTGIKLSTLRAKLNGQNPNNTTLKYI